MTLEGGSRWVEPGYSASDAGVDMTSFVVAGAPNMLQLGAQVITYSIIDRQGLATSKTRTVTVQDTTPPVITMNGNAVMNREACCTGSSPLCAGSCTYTDPGATAIDVVGASINVVTTGLPLTDLTTPDRSYTITYTATDGSGNTATATRTVTIVDGSVPIITLRGVQSQRLEASLTATFTELGATCADITTPSIPVTATYRPGRVNVAVPNTYYIDYDCTDGTGNSASTVTQTIIVADTTPPVLNLNGSTHMTWQGSFAWVDPGYTATDTLDLDLTSDVTVNPRAVDVFRDAGTTQVLTYNVLDTAGNLIQYPPQRSVTIIDTIPPVIYIPNVTVVEHEQCSDLVSVCNEIHYYSANDTMPPFDLTGVVNVTTNATLNYSAPHGTTFQVMYEVRDRAGNEAEVKGQLIRIVDTTFPTISMRNVTADNKTYWNHGDAYVDAGATAMETVTPFNVTDRIVVSGVDAIDVNDVPLSQWIVTYAVTDNANNTAYAYRTVILQDNTPPEIELTGACSCMCTPTVVTSSPTLAPSASPTEIPTMAPSASPTDMPTMSPTETNFTYNSTMGGSSSTMATMPGSTMGSTTMGSTTTTPVCPGSGATCNCPPGKTALPFFSKTEIVWEAGVPWVDPGYSAWDPGYDSVITDQVAVIASIPYLVRNDFALGCNGVNLSALAPANTSIFAGQGSRTADTNHANGTRMVLDYTVYDAIGNTDSQYRTITLVDRTPPTIVLNGAAAETITDCNTFVDPWVNASDLGSGDISGCVTAQACISGSGGNCTTATSAEELSDWLCTTFPDYGRGSTASVTYTIVDNVGFSASTMRAVTYNIVATSAPTPAPTSLPPGPQINFVGRARYPVTVGTNFTLPPCTCNGTGVPATCASNFSASMLDVVGTHYIGLSCTDSYGQTSVYPILISVLGDGPVPVYGSGSGSVPEDGVQVELLFDRIDTSVETPLTMPPTPAPPVYSATTQYVMTLAISGTVTEATIQTQLQNMDLAPIDLACNDDL
jgi:hypothetical protein